MLKMKHLKWYTNVSEVNSRDVENQETNPWKWWNGQKVDIA